MPRKKMKSISIQILKPSHFRPLRENQVSYHLNFNPKHWNHVISDDAHQIQVNFDAHTNPKSLARIQKSFSTITKPSQFRGLHCNHINFDLQHQNQVISMPKLKPSHFRIAHQNQVHFDHPHKNQVNRTPRWTQVIFGPHTTASKFQPPHNDQVSFDHHTKTKSFGTPTQKPSQFRSAHKIQLTFDPKTRTSIFIRTLAPSHLWGAHKKKPISTASTKSKPISTSTVKPTLFRSPT